MKFLLTLLLLVGCDQEILSNIEVFSDVGYGFDASIQESVDAGSPFLPYCCNVYCNSPESINTDPACIERPLEPCRGDTICTYNCDTDLSDLLNGFGWEVCSYDGVYPGTTGPYNCVCYVHEE